MRRLKGAYSLTIMTNNKLIAVRDPLGIRPLCLGTLNGGNVIASETAALDNLGAEFVRELENGETVIIDESGIRSRIWPGANSAHAMCVFEQIYFARPDSVLNGELAYETRQRLGAEVYKEHPVDADIVVGIPDSSIPHAVGLAAEAKIPYAEAIIRNRYVGRTFIQPVITEYIGAESLAYLSVDGLMRAGRAPKEEYCKGCFTGDYPIPIQLEMDKMRFESSRVD